MGENVNTGDMCVIDPEPHRDQRDFTFQSAQLVCGRVDQQEVGHISEKESVPAIVPRTAPHRFAFLKSRVTGLQRKTVGGPTRLFGII